MKSIFMTRFHMIKLSSTSNENGSVRHIQNMNASNTVVSGVREKSRLSFEINMPRRVLTATTAATGKLFRCQVNACGFIKLIHVQPMIPIQGWRIAETQSHKMIGASIKSRIYYIRRRDPLEHGRSAPNQMFEHVVECADDRAFRRKVSPATKLAHRLNALTSGFPHHRCLRFLQCRRHWLQRPAFRRPSPRAARWASLRCWNIAPERRPRCTIVANCPALPCRQNERDPRRRLPWQVFQRDFSLPSPTMASLAVAIRERLSMARWWPLSSTRWPTESSRRSPVRISMPIAGEHDPWAGSVQGQRHSESPWSFSMNAPDSGATDRSMFGAYPDRRQRRLRVEDQTRGRGNSGSG